jgi:1-deoxy-D-xylulose-5-phosphate reductoisomerase
VHAFLSGRLRFLDIANVIEETLAVLPTKALHSFDSLMAADLEAREIASEIAERLPH